MEINILNLFYLFFRFAPFLIVSYFTLQSIFNQDLKGVIYLIGLLIACVITVLFARLIPETPNPNIASSIKCNQLTIGPDQPLSKLPLSQTVFGFTLAYLSYFISINNLQTQNVPTFVVFPLFILGDMIWNIMNGCSTNILLMTALIIGGFVGAFWALIIDTINSPNLAYYSGINKEVCSRPTKSLYRCRAVNTNNSAIASTNVTTK